jgi:hypothetical protein
MKTLPQLANPDSANQNESLWGQVTKHSEGKLLTNMSHLQAWEAATCAATLQVSNGERCASESHDKIGLKTNLQQSQHQERVEQKRKKDFRNHHNPLQLPQGVNRNKSRKLKAEDSKKMR